MNARRRSGARIVAIASLLLVAACAGPPARPVIMQADGPACTRPTLAVSLVHLDADATPVTGPEITRMLYPDRAERMLQDGEAVYACTRSDLAVVCTPEQITPAGYSFEHAGRNLARFVSPALGQTRRVRLDFKIVERGDCW